MEMAIGATVAAKTGLKIGDSFASNHGLSIDGDEHEDSKFKVVGIFKPSNTVLDQLILTQTATIWQVHEHEKAEKNEPVEPENRALIEADELHKHEMAYIQPQATLTPSVSHTSKDERTALLEADSTKQITSLLIQFKNNKNIQALNFQRNMNENTDMQAATPALELNRLFEMMGVGEKALKSLAFLIVFVSGLSIFIALFSSLKERRYELALMRVMGAGRTKLFLLIVLEGLLLSFIGFIVGIALSHGAMQILAHYMSDAYRYSFTGWTWMKEEWYLLLGALGIGFVAAIIPALNAYQTDISRTLSKA